MTRGSLRINPRRVDARGPQRPILRAPTQLDFGYTFTSADPDGHRVRIFMSDPH